MCNIGFFHFIGRNFLIWMLFDGMLWRCCNCHRNWSPNRLLYRWLLSKSRLNFIMLFKSFQRFGIIKVKDVHVFIDAFLLWGTLFWAWSLTLYYFKGCWRRVYLKVILVIDIDFWWAFWMSPLFFKSMKSAKLLILTNTMVLVQYKIH